MIFRQIIIFAIWSFGTQIFAQSVTFQKDIKPIILDHCLKCHHQNGIAPIPFQTYEEVSSYGQMIQFVTESKYMPPWLAVNESPHFLNRNVLSDSEIDAIRNWVQIGMPNGHEILNAQVEVESEVVNFDIEFKMAEPFEQYDIYYDQFQVFVIPFDIGYDTLVSAIQFIPGDSTIVRSCQISIATDSAKVYERDNWDPRPGYNSFGGVGFNPDYSHWFDWSAGDEPMILKNQFVYLPARGYFLLHIHYGPTDERKKDQSSFKVKFASKNQVLKENILQTIPLISKRDLTKETFLLKPNEIANQHAKTVLSQDTYLHRLYAQCNLFCKSIQVFAKIPGENEVVSLLKIDHWDFKWRRGYFFEKPIFLPKGTEVHAFARFDNSSGNTSAPSDKSTTILWGDQMFQDMLLIHATISVKE